MVMRTSREDLDFWHILGRQNLPEPVCNPPAPHRSAQVASRKYMNMQPLYQE